jgi:phosphoglycerate dehydrogenase-like enzyme
MLQALKHLGIKALSSLREAPWKSEHLPHVAIQIFRGFEQELWEKNLDSHMLGWKTQVEVVFVRDQMDFYAALPRADICSTMELNDTLIRISKHVRWINILLGGIDFWRISVVPSGVQITTSRGIAAQSMAEHALALMFALDRGLTDSVLDQQAWNWRQGMPLEGPGGFSSKTAVIIGLGPVGLETARLCRALNMKVIAVRFRHHELADVCDQVYLLKELHKVLPLAAVVVLAIPLTKQTYRLIGRSELELMKPASYLINVARGELVDEEALAQALRDGSIGGAGLDVLSQEPPPELHPLRGCRNLIITPHVAGNINTFKVQIAERFVRNLAAFLNGGPLEGLVPPEYWQSVGAGV